MSYLASHFTDSLVLIYDNESNLIAKTNVTAHDKGEMYIEVSEGLENVKPGTRLRLLIIHSSGVSELRGILKSVRQGIYEISIYGERVRDARSSARYTLNNPAIISDMVTDSKMEELIVPLKVTIENISSTGILVRSLEVRIKLGALLQIEFNAHGKNGIIYGEVIREQICDDCIYKYGCQLIFIDGGEKKGL